MEGASKYMYKKAIFFKDIFFTLVQSQACT